MQNIMNGHANGTIAGAEAPIPECSIRHKVILNGVSRMVNGPIMKMRQVKRKDALVLQYGRSCIVFVDGKYSHEEIEWTDVEVVEEDEI